MTHDLRQRFSAIRAFYKESASDIAEAGSNEWGIDPYAWDATGIVMTPIERALWSDIRACNAVMYPQFPVGRYFVDFGNPVAKVAIECDGAAFHTDQARDAARQKHIEAIGWTVYRLTGSECFTDTTVTPMDDGPDVVTHGFARSFVMWICDQHPISRFDRKPSHDPMAGVRRLLQRCADRRAAR